MPDEKPPSFEAGLTELETVVKELENGDLPLEQASACGENVVGLSDRCRLQLEEAETRVEILLKKNGQIKAEPFEGN